MCGTHVGMRRRLRSTAGWVMIVLAALAAGCEGQSVPERAESGVYDNIELICSCRFRLGLGGVRACETEYAMAVEESGFRECAERVHSRAREADARTLGCFLDYAETFRSCVLAEEDLESRCEDPNVAERCRLEARSVVCFEFYDPSVGDDWDRCFDAIDEAL